MKEKERQEMERLQALEAYQKKRQKQSNDIIKENHDRVSAVLPKGTIKRINDAGESVNGLIKRLVLDYLDSLENK